MKNLMLLAILSICAFFACKKNPDTPVTPPTPTNTCVAGRNGNLTYVAFPQHHGKPILNHSNYLDTVYVKYSAKEYPSKGLKGFDTIFVGEAGEDHVHLKGLKCGRYYFFAAGYDTTIRQRVTGGIVDSTTLITGEKDINIPVTE